jgi:drug/metabolite transporter (DMT)-like permease
VGFNVYSALVMRERLTGPRLGGIVAALAGVGCFAI